MVSHRVPLPILLKVSTTAAIIIAVSSLTLVGGCPARTGTDGPNSLVFNNSTDPTNGGARYIGSSACIACHAQICETICKHGHSHALTPTEGLAPVYSPAGTRAGVPDPPAGKTWSDVSYVISGYLLNAFFVDASGFIMTDGVDGVNTQWNLDFPANGTAAGFVAYHPEQTTPLPYDFATCFRCHTTGPQAQDPNNPRSQDGRPGILGTWAEAGVRCEACHGPGSYHAPSPQARNIFVDSTSKTCGRCHTAGDDPNTILATDSGYIRSNSQYPELRASGGHAQFSCMVCHDPHASMAYDQGNGWRNRCNVCHTDNNMAFHSGLVFRWGDYEEELSCKSCHMPLAGRNGSNASVDVVGREARVGDVHSHIFRIDAQHGRYAAMLSQDGTSVVKDASGRAALTLDYVCLRCHHGAGNAFTLSADGAPVIARGMHENAAAANRD